MRKKKNLILGLDLERNLKDSIKIYLNKVRVNKLINVKLLLNYKIENNYCFEPELENILWSYF